jgi:hypothetical protein
MRTRLYRIFISSTYEDLKRERSAIIRALLKAECIPSGMEHFPASDKPPWDVIQRAIELSDYYVVVIGSRYGSLSGDQISYTEREHDYAVGAKIPVLAFIKESAPPSGEEVEEPLSLARFREKVRARQCNFWKTTPDLLVGILTTLAHSFKDQPRPGWIRGRLPPLPTPEPERSWGERTVAAGHPSNSIREVSDQPQVVYRDADVENAVDDLLNAKRWADVAAGSYEQQISGD